MDVADGVASDELVVGDECAVISNNGRYRKGDGHCSGAHILHLQLVVPIGKRRGAATCLPTKIKPAFLMKKHIVEKSGVLDEMANSSAKCQFGQDRSRQIGAHRRAVVRAHSLQPRRAMRGNERARASYD